MATKRSERVTRLINNFMKYHNQGLSTSEIASKFQVTTRTIYANLQEIADLNGVDRSSLLMYVHKPHAPRGPNAKKVHKELNMDELIKDYTDMISFGKNIISKIDTILEEE